ncbi:hypothetical protein GCM10023083_70830 [Streptomyces phyllanthi]
MKSISGVRGLRDESGGPVFESWLGVPAAASGVALTRFVHVYDSQSRMARNIMSVP